MDKLNITYFQRKRHQNGNYSLEFIFDDVRNRLQNRINSQIFITKYHSAGIFKRAYNAVEAAFNQNEVNHITGDVHYISFFLKKNKTVLTILDCGFLSKNSQLKHIILKLFWLTIPARRVKYITAISDFTKADILSHISFKPENIIVIPVAINTQFNYTPKEFNAECPVLLQIGAAPNKNLLRIIEAIKGLNVTLSIVGKISDENIAILKNENINFTIAYNLSNEEVLQKYISADVLLFPSTFEGFGMPILEAQAVGRPVITSNVASMPEVAGGAACLVNPFDVADIRNGVLKVILDAGYRENLVRNGLENIKRYNPEVISNQYFELYNKIINENKH